MLQNMIGNVCVGNSQPEEQIHLSVVRPALYMNLLVLSSTILHVFVDIRGEVQ